MNRSILIVSPFLPWPVDFGGAARVFHLARALAINHDVIMCAPATPAEAASLDALGRYFDVTSVPAHWSTRQEPRIRKRAAQLGALAAGRAFLGEGARGVQFQAVIDRLFLTRQIDLVQFEFSQMGTFTTPRPCPTVINIHNVEHELLRQLALTSGSGVRQVFNTLEAPRVRWLEQRAWRRATALITTSEADAARVEQAVGVRPSVVPNGVDVAYFTGSANPVQRSSIVFTGAMRHAPNADGARWYLDRVHPMVCRQAPGARVSIVGADPPADIAARAKAGVEVTGRVDDVRPWLHQARVAIVPLRSGGGTRLKILEALAAGVPVVSTTVGAEGLDLEPESDILIADDPETFAASVVRALHDDRLVERLALRGIDTAGRFDWSIVGERLVRVHAEAIRRFAESRAQEGATSG